MTTDLPRVALAAALAAAFAGAGCRSIGPATVPRDRVDYTTAIGESWKGQMLLNLVKIRYADVPVFLDVQQVVASYSVSGTASAGLSGLGAPPTGGAFEVGGSWASNPTISYAPATGAEFARTVLLPIPVISVLDLIQAGYPIDGVMRVTVQSINGVDNRKVFPLHAQPADPQFYTLVALLRRIQSSGDVSMFASQSQPAPSDNGGSDPDDSTSSDSGGDASTKKPIELRLVIRPNLSAAVEQARKRVAAILGTDPDTLVYQVVYGSVAANKQQIAIQTRSILQVLRDVALDIEVPQSEVSEDRVSPTAVAEIGPDGPVPPVLRVKNAKERPIDAFAAVQYRGIWFYIDDHDISSKRNFTFLLFLSSFVGQAASTNLPVLTIPSR